MSALACAEVLPHLESYRRGDASGELSALVDEHLARCPACRRQLAHLKQVSAMLAAWRPLGVPAELKIEVAEAVSSAVGAEARRVYAERRRRKRRERRTVPRLSAYQRAANALALVGLVFLGAAILWRLVFMPSGPDETAGPGGATPTATSRTAEQATFVVKLTRYGVRDTEVIKLFRELTGMGQQEAERLIDRLPRPVVVKRGVTREAAERIKERFEAIGADVEVRGPGSRGTP